MFYMISSYIWGFIALGFLCMACYAIIFHSPKNIDNEFKTYLCIQCTLGLFASFGVSCGGLPVFVAPCYGGYMTGFMRYSGISFFRQVLTFSLEMYCLGAVTVLMFYLRFRAFQVHTRPRQNYIVYGWVIVQYVLIPITVNLTTHLENIEEVKRDCLKIYKGDPMDIMQEETTVVSFSKSGTSFQVYLYVTSPNILVFFTEICILTGLILVRFNELKQSMSQQTQNTHKMFMKINFMQGFVIAGITNFTVLSTMLPYLGIFINEVQALVIAMVSVHFVCGVLLTLYTVPSYRNIILISLGVRQYQKYFGRITSSEPSANSEQSNQNR